MSKKFLTLFIALLPCVAAMSQNNVDVPESQNEEESLTSLQDIIATQQDLNDRGSFSTHIEDVWQRGGYFNFVYHSPATMTFLETASEETSMKGRELTADFGFAIQSGKNHRLHKKPIANMIGINLDYTPLDLFANKYKGYTLYAPGSASSDKVRPWNNNIWEVNYSMSLGPSLTIAPFVPIKNEGLSYFRLNVYYHVGYCASAMVLSAPEKEKKGLTADFGHGLYTSFGLNLSWKVIGLGFEHREGNYKYLPLGGAFEGNYQISSKQTRFYINLRF